MQLTDTELASIREMDGKHCPTCFKPVAIDRYGITPTMITVLREMAAITNHRLKHGDGREIDIRKTTLNHNERSTLSKMRQHGLIAKVKGSDGRHIAGHWLVTRRGFDFLGGGEVPAKVEIYNNTVLGHPGGTTNIHAIEKADKLGNDASVIEREYIDPAEAQALSTTREPKKQMTFRAILQRRDMGEHVKGDEVEITVDGLAFGKPVNMIKPYEMQYKDISAFRADWKIAK